MNKGITFEQAAAAVIPNLYHVAPVDKHVGQRVVGPVRGGYRTDIAVPA